MKFINMSICDPVNVNRDWYIEYYVSIKEENFKDRMENFNAGNKVQQLWHKVVIIGFIQIMEGMEIGSGSWWNKFRHKDGWFEQHGNGFNR